MSEYRDEAAGVEETSAAPAGQMPPDADIIDAEPADGDEVVTGAEALDGDAATVQTGAGDPTASGEADHPDSQLAAERLEDLQRLQAEYVNYKRRVDRDRAVAKDAAIHSVLESLLPVLDEIHLAREHGDLADGPLASIATKLETVLGKYGLTRYGAVGEVFDPEKHEALMNAPWPADDPAVPQDATGTTVVALLQPGYRAGERVLRAARVTVADPE